jgi:hypothetical protein
MLKLGIGAVAVGLTLAAWSTGFADSGANADTTAARDAQVGTRVRMDREPSRQDLLEVAGQVHGKQGRRRFRTAYWIAGLEGDMRTIYDAYGYPSSRYRETKADVTFERWTYLDAGKQFIFRAGRLVRTREFNPGSAAGMSLR